jgi:transposase-like protein
VSLCETYQVVAKEMHTMALDQSALMELLDALKAADGGDVVRSAVQAVFQALIEAEATTAIGAGPHERSPQRVTRRNGHRDRLLTTTAGDVELRIPKLRSGSFFPSLLERRRRIDQVRPGWHQRASRENLAGTATRAWPR